MRKLIETTQENSIECDNPLCDYVISNETEDPNAPLDKYLNVPCPKCGENLLTYDDLVAYKKSMKLIKFLNRWFSWLRWFGSKDGSGTIKTHKGVHFEIDKE